MSCAPSSPSVASPASSVSSVVDAPAARPSAAAPTALMEWPLHRSSLSLHVGDRIAVEVQLYGRGIIKNAAGEHDDAREAAALDAVYEVIDAWLLRAPGAHRWRQRVLESFLIYAQPYVLPLWSEVRRGKSCFDHCD